MQVLIHPWVRCAFGNVDLKQRGHENECMMGDEVEVDPALISIHVLEKGKVRAARARMTTKTFQQG